MSYELRTPLTSIGGFGEMLRAGYAGPLGEQQQSYIEAIMESVGVLGRQIDDVLDLAPGEAGTLAIDRAPVDIRALLDAALAERDPFEAGEGLDPARPLGAGARRSSGEGES